MICIGFAGIEAFDVILYISRTLTKLKKKVLIIDISEAGAIKRAINHGMNLDSREESVNYRRISYIRRVLDKGELERSQVDVIIVVFGQNYINFFPIRIQSINVVANIFPNILDDTNKLIKKLERQDENIRILIRDTIDIDDLEKVRSSLCLPEVVTDINYIYVDQRDYESAVRCQRSQLVRFTRISPSMKRYIREQIYYLLPEIKKKQINKAIIAARRGV